MTLGPVAAGAAQLAVAVYGGYFGDGIGFLMLAALSLAGLPTRNAGATKNVLAGAMNASAVAVFALPAMVHWLAVLILGVSAVVSGPCGAWMLRRINERLLRVAIVAVGLAPTAGLFVRPV